jgi:predicted DCC family thiol-disulfide oxidoreductase YuxK
VQSEGERVYDAYLQRLPVTANLTVWFDGACPLCTREIKLMRRLDRAQRIDFIDVGDPAAACPIDRTVLLARFHARENGQMLSGAAAFAAMWRAIPLLRPLGLAARNRFILRLLEAAYVRFLRMRPSLQRLVR